MWKFIAALKNFFSAETAEERISWFVIISLAVISIFFILYKADWLLGDNFPFLFTTAQRKFYPLVTVFKVGETRFFPFAFLDFNLLPLIPGAVSGFAHYVYVAFSYIVFCLFFLFSCKKICEKHEIKHGMYFAASAFLLSEAHSGFFDSFLNIMFPERVVIILFAVFVFLILKYSETQKTYLLVLAFLSAFLATYFKETVFAFFVVYAAWTLFFKKDCGRNEKIFSYSLIANGIIFLLMYYIFAWKGHGNIYRADAVMGIWPLLRTVFQNSALLLFVFSFAAARLYKCLILKQESITVIDPLLAASSVFALEYIVLGYSSNYYYAPAITAGAIPVVFYAVRIAAQKRYAGALAIVFLCLVPFIEMPSVSAIIHTTIIERTKVMPGLRMMAEKYASGGKIYWFQPWNKSEKIFNLTEIYINFILNREMGKNRGQNDSVLTVTETVPELGVNDIFLYMAMNNGQFNADSLTLSALREYGFEFCQFQTGYMVFAKGKCSL